jgi:prepilin-type N-terminal cleavage/methylation domain-containing protein
MKINAPAKNNGFTVLELMIVCAIIALMAAIAVPTFAKSTNTTKTNTCMSNLRLINDAKEQWALEKNQTDGADAESARAEISEYLKGNKAPGCPAGGTYDYTKVGEPATCTVAGHTL